VEERHLTQTIGNIIRWADEHPKEQKPAEWSKEDNVMLNNIIWGVHMRSIKPLDEMDDRSKYEKYEDFLKSLPTRFSLRPKAEWSEEDDNMMNDLISLLWILQGSTNLIQGTASKYTNWLKSLRPQSHWKPSDEQMEWLESAVKLSTDKPHIHGIIISLYEQLKRI
jgi:hypothetical protein